MKYYYPLRLLFSLGAAVALGPTLCAAAPFTPGNIVVARVGDGSAALNAAATEVFLDEYTRSGTLVQTIALPTSVSGTNRILTASGNTLTELGMTTSADGHYLVLTGYSAAPGTSSVATSQAVDITRVIGLIGADGSVDTSTSAGEAFSGTSIRAAATADGTSFYSVGGDGGIQYQAFGDYQSTPLTTDPANIRSINIANGNLYISTNASPYVGLSQVGTGLPTAAQTVTALPGFPASTAGASPNAFYFADLSADVPGVDVVYVADDRTVGGGIQKWSLVGSTWVLNGTITSTAAAAVRGLNGSTTGSAVALVASSSNRLFFLEDNAGYNTAPSVAALRTATAVAGTNTAFRGIAFAPVAAVPTIASFTPGSGPVGTTVTVTGTYLNGATTLTLNGADVPDFTVVDAATLTFEVPADATSGLIAVTTPGGTATSTSTFTVTVPNPAPTLTSLTPATAVTGSGPLTVTVNGTGFLSSSVASFNGTALATTLVSATQLTVVVPASALATAGAYAITVTNPAPGGGTSDATNFTVVVPAPTIASFTPAVGGLVGTTVTVTGTNFNGATSVTLNGVAVPSFAVVDATTLTFVVPVGATSGAIAVTTPGGTATSTSTFTVTAPNPAPTLTSLTPATAAAGSGSLTITVNGTGFLSSSVASFNGMTLVTTLVSATQLTAVVPASALLTTGIYAVVVTNPAPGGGTSATTNFTVVAPAPTIASFTPTTGGPGTTVTISGTNFTGATSVKIGSLAIANYTVVSATTITLVLPSSTSNLSGLLTVVTPGGTATSTASFNLVLATLASQALPGLAVFPNPATDYVQLALPQPGNATVTLRDLTGRVVMAPVELATRQPLYLPASLTAGVYLLEVRQGTETAVRRFEKK